MEDLATNQNKEQKTIFEMSGNIFISSTWLELQMAGFYGNSVMTSAEYATK